MVVLANMLSATEMIKKNHTDMIKEAYNLTEAGYFLKEDSEAAVEEGRKDMDGAVSTGTFFIRSKMNGLN